MLEQKLIVGRYIDLVTGTPGLVGGPNAGFQEVNRVVLHIEESESKSAPVAPNNPVQGFNPNLKQKVAIGFQRAGQNIQSTFDRQRTSGTGVGPSAKVHRNFVWLEWLAGLVSEVRPAGVDVLTGPMSGCWVTSYIRNGVHYVGHVGTDMERNHPNSIAARDSWNAFTAHAQIASYTGFNPFNDPWAGPMPMGLPGESTRKTFALVTAAGQFYTIIAYPQAHKPSRIRIAGIQQKPASLPPGGQIV